MAKKGGGSDKGSGRSLPRVRVKKPNPASYFGAPLSTDTTRYNGGSKIAAANTAGLGPASSGGGGGSSGGGGGAAAVSTLAGLPQSPLLATLIKNGLIKEGMPPEQALAVLKFAQLREGVPVNVAELMKLVQGDYAKYTGDITTAGQDWMEQLMGTAYDPSDPNARMFADDPIFSDYAGGMAQMQETADTNLATDLAWFRKNQEAQEQYYNDMMTAISTGTLPVGAAAAGGGSGGGGGGGRGGGGYGGGGGGGGNSGGNGLEFGDPRTTLDMQETAQDRATSQWKQFHPGYTDAVLKWAQGLGLSPEDTATAQEWVEHLINLEPRPDGTLALGEEEFYDMTGKMDAYASTEALNQNWSTKVPGEITRLLDTLKGQGFEYGDDPLTASMDYLRPTEGSEASLLLDPVQQQQQAEDLDYINKTFSLATGNTPISTDKINLTAMEQAYRAANPEVLEELSGNRGSGNETQGEGQNAAVQNTLDAIGAAQGNSPYPGNGAAAPVYIPGATPGGIPNQAGPALEQEQMQRLMEQLQQLAANRVGAPQPSITQPPAPVNASPPTTIPTSAPQSEMVPPSAAPVTGTTIPQPSITLPPVAQPPSTTMADALPQGTGEITPENYGGGPVGAPAPSLPSDWIRNQVLGTIPNLPSSPKQLAYPGQDPYYSNELPTPQQLASVIGGNGGTTSAYNPGLQTYGTTSGLADQYQEGDPIVDVMTDPYANAGQITNTDNPTFGDKLERLIPDFLPGGGGGDSYNARFNTPVGEAFNSDAILQIMNERGFNQGSNKVPTPPPNPVEVIGKVLGGTPQVSPTGGDKSYDISRTYNVDTRDIEDIQNENEDRSEDMRDWAEEEENSALIQALANPMTNRYIDRQLFTVDEAGFPIVKPQAEYPSQQRSILKAREDFPYLDQEAFDAQMSSMPGEYYTPHTSFQEEDFNRASLLSQFWPSLQDIIRGASEQFGMAPVSNQYQEQDTTQQRLGSKATAYSIPAAELTGMGDPNALPIEEIDTVYNTDEFDPDSGFYGDALRLPTNVFSGLNMNNLMQAAQNKISVPRKVSPAPPSDKGTRPSSKPVRTYNKAAAYNKAGGGKKVKVNEKVSSSSPKKRFRKKPF